MNDKLADKCKEANFAEIFAKKGYAYFTKGNYNLNIIGVRSNQQNKVTNKYDDVLVVQYNVNKKQITKIYSITTEPGLKEVLAPSNAKGVAILVPNQYRGVYTIDRHKNKYKALCQRLGNVKVYRDDNKNQIYDCKPETISTGKFGINIHRSDSFKTRTTIDGYSAGCQVFNNPKEFAEFMSICENAKTIWGNKFTYTLINEEDL